jgi:hypothetical protein
MCFRPPAGGWLNHLDVELKRIEDIIQVRGHQAS